MSSSIVGGCPLGRLARSRVVWNFHPLTSPTGGRLDVSIWRRVGGVDELVATARVGHISTKHRDLRAAHMGAAYKELRKLAKWAAERADAMKREDRP